jgi:hypothetical protein
MEPSYALNPAPKHDDLSTRRNGWQGRIHRFSPHLGARHQRASMPTSNRQSLSRAQVIQTVSQDFYFNSRLHASPERWADQPLAMGVTGTPRDTGPFSWLVTGVGEVLLDLPKRE